MPLIAFAGAGGHIAPLAGAVLIATVFAAVYHAEVVAHRIGEPFGTLVLAVAVTVIEVALIVSVMLAFRRKGGLARDTVFAAVMIVCNGIVGLCLLSGGVRHHEQGFPAPGSERRPGRAGRAHRPHPGSAELHNQRARSAVQPARSWCSPEMVSLVLYGSFVFIQTVRHRDYFLPLEADGDGSACAAALQHARPSSAPACCSLPWSPSSVLPNL